MRTVFTPHYVSVTGLFWARDMSLTIPFITNNDNEAETDSFGRDWTNLEIF